MKDARDFRFSLFVTSAVILCCYSVTTLSIYFTFGEDVKVSIALPPSDALKN